MFRQEDIIHNVPITEYYQLTPTEHYIIISQLWSRKEYLLTIKIQNLTGHWLTWKLRTRKHCLLDYKPQKKGSCISPYEAFNCVIVVSVKGNITKESLVGAKPDKFYIMGTVLATKQEGYELEATWAERFKLHNKWHKSYVYQEKTHNCHFTQGAEEPPEPTVLKAVTSSEGSQPTKPPLWQEPQMFIDSRVSQFEPGVGDTVFVTSGELCNLKLKAKQYDELVKQMTKIMLERHEAQLKLHEQVTANSFMWDQFSKLKKELKKSKLTASIEEETKTGDHSSRMFLEHFSYAQLSDFKQPTAISLTMTQLFTLFSSAFYIIGRYFGDRNC